MKHICSNCIASEICYSEGKKPNDTCPHWEWRYTGLWFDN